MRAVPGWLTDVNYKHVRVCTEIKHYVCRTKMTYVCHKIFKIRPYLWDGCDLERAVWLFRVQQEFCVFGSRSDIWKGASLYSCSGPPEIQFVKTFRWWNSGKRCWFWDSVMAKCGVFYYVFLIFICSRRITMTLAVLQRRFYPSILRLLPNSKEHSL